MRRLIDITYDVAIVRYISVEKQMDLICSSDQIAIIRDELSEEKYHSVPKFLSDNDKYFKDDFWVKLGADALLSYRNFFLFIQSGMLDKCLLPLMRAAEVAANFLDKDLLERAKDPELIFLERDRYTNFMAVLWGEYELNIHDREDEIVTETKSNSGKHAVGVKHQDRKELIKKAGELILSKAKERKHLKHYELVDWLLAKYQDEDGKNPFKGKISQTVMRKEMVELFKKNGLKHRVSGIKQTQ